MLQSEIPDDYVLATNETHSVREFVELSFKYANINIRWENKGINEVGINSSNNEIVVKIDPKYFRPTEVDLLIGDYSKAKTNLGWEPTIKFEQLVKEMMDYDLNHI